MDFIARGVEVGLLSEDYLLLDTEGFLRRALSIHHGVCRQGFICGQAGGLEDPGTTPWWMRKDRFGGVMQCAQMHGAGRRSQAGGSCSVGFSSCLLARERLSCTGKCFCRNAAYDVWPIVTRRLKHGSSALDDVVLLILFQWPGRLWMTQPPDVSR